MAITNYKKVEDNKGYFLQDKDRKIFEKEVSKSYFGFDEGDTIEFVIYDTNDNPLPQASANGKNVRYIQYNDSTEKKYFGKTQLNKENIQPNQAEEFFIDTEKLLNEAGYSQGTFKTSITLLNRRLGSEEVDTDKVWIHEISPSRTEIRILPTVESTGKPNSDLENRYQTFVDCGIFKADVAPFIDDFVAQFDVQTTIENFFGLRGSITDGQNYIKLIESEFKLSSFDSLIQRVKTKFDEAVGYYKTNRVYDVTSNMYGQPISSPKTTFSVDEIYNDILDIVTNCIDFYLPKRNIQEQNESVVVDQESIDELEKLLETVTSDSEFDSTIPDSISAKVKGCKDPLALNYDEFADIHDQSLCVYLPDIEVVDIDVPDDSNNDSDIQTDSTDESDDTDVVTEDTTSSNTSGPITGGTGGGGNSTQSDTNTNTNSTGGGSTGAGNYQSPDNDGIPTNDDTVFTQDNMDTLGQF